MEFITSLQKTFRFFKQPDKVGDLLDYKDRKYLILGIEQLYFGRNFLTVTYTAQNVAYFNYSDQVKVSVSDSDLITLKIQHDSVYLKKVFIGSVMKHKNKNGFFKIKNILDVSFNFTDFEFLIEVEGFFPVRKEIIKNIHKDVMKNKFDLVVNM